MDFSLTSEQEALQDSVRRFCERDYPFERRQALLKTELGFERGNWTTFADLGWLGAGLSEEQGGFGGGPIENAMIQENLARALVVEPFLSSAILATQAIAALAPPDQREALLPPIISGEQVAVLAHGEASLQDLSPSVKSRAMSSNGGYKISGRKCFVLGGPSADILLISARIGGEDDHVGVSLFAVPANAKGVERFNYHAVDGRRVSDIVLHDVEIASDALIGEAGGAANAIELALDHGVIGLCAEAVGAMDAALWLTRDYLQTRKQFGVTLSTFQALQHRMADMLVETELARSMLFRGIGALMQQDAQVRRKAVSAAKAQIGEAGFFVGTQAVQLHGGIGVTEEYIVGHYFKRLSLVRGFLGGTDQHLMRFAQIDSIQDAA